MPNEDRVEIEGQQVDFELVYEGPEVDDGTIAVRDLIGALTGISEALSRTSQEYDNLPEFSVRVSDIEANSVHILFQLVEFAKANPAATAALGAVAVPIVTAVSNSLSGLYRVVTDLAKMIEAKKRLKGGRIATTQTEFAEGRVILMLPDGPLELTKEQYELLLSRRVDTSLSKIVAPLSPKRIQDLELRGQGKTLVRVEAPERGYFDYTEIVVEQSKEGDQIEGTLNSLSKSTMRGTFYTTEGVHVPYRYTGSNLAELLEGFSTRETVRVYGKVKYGPDGLPTSIEVNSLEPLQRRLTG